MQRRLDAGDRPRRDLLEAGRLANLLDHLAEQPLRIVALAHARAAGLADRAEMVDYVKEHGIKTIFIESSINPAIIQAIAKESGARVGGELFSDAMGDPGKMEKGPDGDEYDVGTWVGMMKHNLNVIVEGLK